jgi:serine/threonine-protein kinase HipA
VQPDLALEGGPFHTSGQPGQMRDALAGVFADAAPDSWGRRLLERVYGNGLSEFEYLTLSDDACRQGALRFQNEDGLLFDDAEQFEVLMARCADIAARASRVDA